MRSALLALPLLLTLAGPASAQAAGPNGGQTTVADGHPVELVSTDKDVTFFVTGDDGKPLDTAGLSAKAHVRAAGKTSMIALTPVAPNKLVGTLSAPLTKGAKVVLSTKVHGHNLQARFEK